MKDINSRNLGAENSFTGAPWRLNEPKLIFKASSGHNSPYQSIASERHRVPTFGLTFSPTTSKDPHLAKVPSSRHILDLVVAVSPTPTQATLVPSRAYLPANLITHSQNRSPFGAGDLSALLLTPLLFKIMYRSTLRSLRSSTRSLHLSTASARPSTLVNPLSTTSTRFFSTTKSARAIAAPAVGDYHKADGEPTLNSPSELARKISSKVLPRLEKPDVKKVLVVGSGGLSIGQAGEFDYSGELARRTRHAERC